VNLTPLEWAQVLYYAWKYNRDRRDIVRGMVRRYVHSDESFDHDEFLRFVQGDLKQLFTDEDDELFRLMVREQAEDYARTAKSEPSTSRGRVLGSDRDQGRVSRSSRSKR